jgi:hypothetical protein
MMKTRWAMALAVAGLMVASVASAGRPPRDVLGIRIGMSGEEAEERLERLGGQKNARESEGEEERGEVWTIAHPRFAFVYLAVDDERRVAAVQAFAREHARRLRFCDVGDLRGAKQLGSYIFQWNVPGRGGRPGTIVTARSDDSVYVASVAIQSARRNAPERERGER